MNREIKFRALFRHLKSRECVWLQCEPNQKIMDIQAYTQITPWLQYTGLKDKNGVEIYEGDHFGNPDFPVYFSDGSFRLGGTPLIKYLDGETIEKVEGIKGNIYENPEKLK